MAKTSDVRLIDAIMIDPFKGALIDLQLSGESLDARWHQLLDCQYLECVRCEFPGYGSHAVWVDEEGFLREPEVYPQFKIQGVNAEGPMAGYGLLTGLQVPAHAGQEIWSCRIPSPEVAKLVHFENWQHRLKADDYLDQLTRLYLPWP